MLWEGSEDQLVQLCVAFRKAVVAEFQSDPTLAQKVLSEYTPAQLQEFEYMAAQASEEANELKAQIAMSETGAPALEARLNTIVLDMSESSAEMALRVLGAEKLQGFIEDPKSRTQEVSDAFAARKYPNLAQIFRP